MGNCRVSAVWAIHRLLLIREHPKLDDTCNHDEPLSWMNQLYTIIMNESKLINGTIWNINHNGIMDDNGDHSFILPVVPHKAVAEVSE